MTGKQHTAQNVGGPVITISTIRHSLQWHKLSSWTVKPLIFFSLFLFSFLFTSCSLFPTAPIDEDITPGRRDYVWTVDTTARFNGGLFRIYGANLNNMWFTSTEGLGNQLWHYNYGNWVHENRISFDGLAYIHGFDSNNVWIFSGTGNTYQFDGNRWIYHGKYIDPNRSRYYFINSISPDKDNSFFVAGGYSVGDSLAAVLLQYNGRSWKKCNVQIEGARTQIVQILSDETSPLAIFSARSPQADELIVARVFPTNIEVLYTGTYENDSDPSLMKMNGKVYINIGRTLYRLEGNELIEISENTLPEYYSMVLGRNEKDLFYPTKKGVAHYNGSDFVYIYNYYNNPNIRVSDIWFSTSEVCILCIDLQKNINIIIRGKLQ